MDAKIKLTSEHEPLDDAAIESLEQKLEVVLPLEYKEFLHRYNVAVPEDNKVEHGETTTSIDEFFGISDDKLYDLVSQNQLTYFGRLPSGVIAIAHCAGGNLICLQLETGAVFFWDHEEEASPDEPTYDNMTLLAPSFGAFLKLIEPYSGDDLNFDEHRATHVWTAPDFDEKFKDYLIKK